MVEVLIVRLLPKSIRIGGLPVVDFDSWSVAVAFGVLKQLESISLNSLEIVMFVIQTVNVRFSVRHLRTVCGTNDPVTFERCL